MIIKKLNLYEAFKKNGIKYWQIDHFKLYNPDTFDKLSRQAKIDVDVAVNDYKGMIITDSKRR